MTSEEKILLVLAVWCLISIFFISGGAEGYNYKRNFSSLFNFIVAPIFTFKYLKFIDPDIDDIKKITFTLLIVGGYLSLTGIAEHYQLNSLIYPSYIMDSSLGIHYGRARGPFLQAVTMGTVLILTFAGLVYHKLVYKSKYWVNIGGIFLITAIYFTYTRSNWVMLAALILVITVTQKDLRKIGILVILLIIVIYGSGAFSKFSMHSNTLFTGRKNPIYDRLNLMYATMEMIKDEPILGHGYGNFGHYVNGYFIEKSNIPLRGEGEGNHNVFLGLAAEVGVIGSILYLTIFIIAAKKAYSIIRSKNVISNHKMIWAGLTLGLITGYLLSAQLYDPRWFQIINVYLFVFISINAIHHRQAVKLDKS